MHPRNHSQTLTFAVLLMVSLAIFSCNDPCPDYPLAPESLRYAPYQANQTIIFQDSAQNRDTMVVVLFEHLWNVEACQGSNNQTFKFESVEANLELSSSAAHYVNIFSPNPTDMMIMLQPCCSGAVFNSATGAFVNGIAQANYSYQASASVNGTSYQGVATYTGQEFQDLSRIKQVKVALDHGLVAYKDDAGVWWYKL